MRASRKVRKKEEKRRKDEERIRAQRTKRHKQVLGVVIALGLLIGVIWLGINVAPPYDWVQCFGQSDGSVQQHIHFGLFVEIGERGGVFAVSFVRIPENLGIKPFCTYPTHTHTAATPGERGLEYTKIHVQAPNTHPYTLGEFFAAWSEWAEYPSNIYFSPDGVSYYRSQNFEMIVEKDPDLDGNFDSSARSYAYERYVPQDGDGIRLIVHEPFTVVGGPYPGGDLPIVADFTSVRVSGLTFAFSASASGGNAPYTFEWDFVDGTGRITTTNTSITHTFTSSAQYLVVLRIKDASGTLVMVRHLVQA